MARFDRDNIFLADADVVNHTLSKYQALKVEKADLTGDHPDFIDPEACLSFLEVFMLNVFPISVLDVGCCSFTAIDKALARINMDYILQHENKHLFIHIPICYGQMEQECVKYLIQCAINYPKASIVIWVNEFFHRYAQVDLDKVMADYPNVIGKIHLRYGDDTSFGYDHMLMLNNYITVDEFLANQEFRFLQRHRIKILRNKHFEALDRIFGLEPVVESVKN